LKREQRISLRRVTGDGLRASTGHGWGELLKETGRTGDKEEG